MVHELAILNVRGGGGPSFEIDFSKAKGFLEAAPGYLGHQLRRCIETPHRYLLLVNWRTLESHTVGFRESSGYLDFKALLHPHYASAPAVEHFEDLDENR